MEFDPITSHRKELLQVFQEYDDRLSEGEFPFAKIGDNTADRT